MRCISDSNHAEVHKKLEKLKTLMAARALLSGLESDQKEFNEIANELDEIKKLISNVNCLALDSIRNK